MRITPRDLSLLELLCGNTVMSFEEVRLYAFGGLHKATVCNRLKKLEQMQLIRRINVGNFIYKRNMRPVGVVVQITKRGIELLKRFEKFRAEWKAEPVPLNIQSLIHDLELNQVVRSLGERLPGTTITNGKHLASQGGGIHSKMPDAMLEVATADLETVRQFGIVPLDAKPRTGDSLRIAVELELTCKSDRRYRDIITGYRMSRDTERVLYLSHDEAVFRKIQGVLAGFPIKGDIRPHSGMFSFLPLAKIVAEACKAEPKMVQVEADQLVESNASQIEAEAGNIQKNYSEVS